MIILGFILAAICIGGLLIYAFAVNAKPQEIGKIMFTVGLLAFLLFLIVNGSKLLSLAGNG
jgi:hypothetical protein